MRVYKFLSAHFALKSLYERRLKISKVDELNDPFELLPFDLRDEERRRAMHDVKDHFAGTYGVLCFSRAWNDPVVWAHYADRHFGMCLGFELKDEACMPVTYRKEVFALPAPPNTQWGLFGEELIKRLLSVKYENWQYEVEIRSWTNLDEVEDGIYYKDFDPDLRLEEVIAGARCTVPKAGIERALGDFKDSCKITKARAGHDKFEVVEDPEGFTFVRGEAQQ